MNKRIMKLLMAFGVVLLALTACGGDSNEAGNEKKGTLEVAMPPWVNSPPQAWMVKTIIEDHLGWDVKITEADIGLAYASTANGTTDFFVDGWMPGHTPFVEEHAGEIELLSGITVLDAPGLVVPTYVDIDSIEELNDHKDKFKGQIIGIEPGAAIMEQTIEAVEAYDLDFEIVEGSDFARVAVLGDAIDYEEWMVVPGWTPHWMFIKYDLKFLADPANVYGEDNTILPVINKDMRDKAPEVVKFLDNWEVDASVWDEMIYATAVDDKKVKDVVREWVDKNEALVQSWLK